MNQRLVLFKGFLLKRPLTIPLLKRPQMGSFKKASDELSCNDVGHLGRVIDRLLVLDLALNFVARFV